MVSEDLTNYRTDFQVGDIVEFFTAPQAVMYHIPGEVLEVRPNGYKIAFTNGMTTLCGKDYLLRLVGSDISVDVSDFL